MKNLKLPSFYSGNFKIFKNALGEFIPNCPLKHVITITDDIDFVTYNRYARLEKTDESLNKSSRENLLQAEISNPIRNAINNNGRRQERKKTLTIDGYMVKDIQRSKINKQGRRKLFIVGELSKNVGQKFQNYTG